MNFILIIHALAALFTVLFAVYTGFLAFHKSSMHHRVELMSRRMAPLILCKKPKQQIVSIMTKEGFVEDEISELYDKLSLSQTKNQKPANSGN